MLWTYTSDLRSARREAISTEELLALDRDRELYSSLYAFDEHITEYIQNNGSTRGYDGPVFGHYLIVDFDGSDINQTSEAIFPLINRMEDLGVQYMLFYSGSKGYHLYVPKQYVEYPEGFDGKWDLVSTAFAQWVTDEFPELAPYVDMQVYDKQRMFRYPLSLHPERTRRKTLLKYKGRDIEVDRPSQRFGKHNIQDDVVLNAVFMGTYVDTEDVDFQHLCVLHIPEPTVNAASRMAVSVPRAANADTTHDTQAIEFPYDEKHCIYSILRQPHLRGRRHAVALRLQSYWREKGLTLPYIEANMRTWNALLTEPLDDNEMANLLQYHDRYIYTCNDPIKREYCDRTCAFYRAREVNDEHIFIGDQYIDAYIEALGEDQSNYVRLDRIYDELNISPIKPDRGHVTVICAGTNVGKTTFAMNVMMKVKHINWLFLSYEMSGLDIAEKFWKMCGYAGLEVTPDRRRTYTEEIKHIVTIDNPGHIDNMESLVRMVQARRGIEIKGVVLDYLQMIPSRGEIAIEQARHIAKMLKDVAKRLGVTVMVVSQVARDLSGDGNIPLPLQSPKDSGEITNLADKQINLWRPNINRGQEGIPDDIITFFLAKDRHGATGCIADLEYNGERGLINTRR